MVKVPPNSSARLIATLAASNALLLLHIAYPTAARRLWRRLRGVLQRVSGVPSPTSPRRPLPDAKDLDGLLGKDYTPPLPQPVADALQRSQICFLATAGHSLEPHLSLMRFTYCRGLDGKVDEVMVISTQRKTKKYDILTENENVALLVHDFSTHSAEPNHDYAPTEGGKPRYSITLNGTVVVEEGEMAERYRQLHLSRNRAYAQFIVGDDIAIITVHLTRARVCDVNDRVQHFAREPSKEWAQLPSSGGF